MFTLHVYGIDHSRAPLSIREELSFCESELGELLPQFLVGKDPAAGGGVLEAMLLSTCNRTEVYLVLDGEPSSYPLEPLRSYRPGARAMDDACLRYHYTGQAAVSHLFSVAASLRSEVPGDTQIAAQVAMAARIARAANTLGPVLKQVVSTALRAAKRVRRETGLAAGGAGTGPAVLRTLRRFAQRPVHRPVRVLMLGAGVMAEEVASHLLRSGTSSGVFSRRRSAAASSIQPSTIALAGVWARDLQKAHAFGARFGVPALTAADAAALLRNVDAVVGVCRGRVPLLADPVLGPILEARTTPLIVIDLGVPRNLDPQLAARDGIHAVFLDQLHQQMRDRLRIRREAVVHAEGIIAEEAARFQEWRTQWPLRPIRSELYNSVEAILGKWRGVQPSAVRQLRISLHRTLGEAFSSLAGGTKPGLAVNRS